MRAHLRIHTLCRINGRVVHRHGLNNYLWLTVFFKCWQQHKFLKFILYFMIVLFHIVIDLLFDRSKFSSQIIIGFVLIYIDSFQSIWSFLLFWLSLILFVGYFKLLFVTTQNTMILRINGAFFRLILGISLYWREVEVIEWIIFVPWHSITLID